MHKIILNISLDLCQKADLFAQILGKHVLEPLRPTFGLDLPHSINLTVYVFY